LDCRYFFFFAAFFAGAFLAAFLVAISILPFDAFASILQMLLQLKNV